MLDSSRYFVIKIVDPTGRHAFIGMGFTDRGDSFDFNVTLQDHFKREKVEEKVEPASAPLDLGFKAGETIKINIGGKVGQDPSKPRVVKKGGGGGFGLLPPPPSGTIPKIPPMTTKVPSQTSAPVVENSNTSTNDEWGDFASFN